MINKDLKSISWIESIVKSRIRNLEDAEDVCQDIYIRVWKNRNKWNPEKGKFMPWVQTIAMNVIRDYFQMQKKRKKQADAIYNWSRQRQDYNKQFQDVNSSDLVDLLRLISNPRRRHALYFKLIGYTHREIGELLNCSEMASKLLCSRGCGELKKKMQKNIPDETFWEK